MREKATQSTHDSYLGLLHFSIKFKASLSIFAKNQLPEILTVFTPQINLWKSGIFTTLNYPSLNLSFSQ
jgi:hypothetical protein